MVRAVIRPLLLLLSLLLLLPSCDGGLDDGPPITITLPRHGEAVVTSKDESFPVTLALSPLASHRVITGAARLCVLTMFVHESFPTESRACLPGSDGGEGGGVALPAVPDGPQFTGFDITLEANGLHRIIAYLEDEDEDKDEDDEGTDGGGGSGGGMAVAAEASVDVIHCALSSLGVSSGNPRCLLQFLSLEAQASLGRLAGLTPAAMASKQQAWLEGNFDHRFRVRQQQQQQQQQQLRKEGDTPSPPPRSPPPPPAVAAVATHEVILSRRSMGLPGHDSLVLSVDIPVLVSVESFVARHGIYTSKSVEVLLTRALSSILAAIARAQDGGEEGQSGGRGEGDGDGGGERGGGGGDGAGGRGYVSPPSTTCEGDTALERKCEFRGYAFCITQPVNHQEELTGQHATPAAAAAAAAATTVYVARREIDAAASGGGGDGEGDGGGGGGVLHFIHRVASTSVRSPASGMCVVLEYMVQVYIQTMFSVKISLN